jgi:Glyoxalase/Bleomycin resistance protein/Dioxygenase superfamily
LCGTHIQLWQPVHIAHNDAPFRTARGGHEDRALVGKQGGSQPFFGIVTDDCMSECRRMKKAGVKFQGEPQVQPYGTGVTLEDLYGNKIYMNQEPH